ncbi:MAG: 4a-hydroxytetrahydrobiopterin dehydratase [Bacteroidetes bacterium]|nr:4a-hydroxytetrahydrobiopterin dehydratase [Bacteroidota bacterium]
MNWQLINDHYIYERKFKSQTELAEFLMKIAVISDQLNHHADWTITKAYHLRMQVYTHDTGTLTSLDHELVKQLEKV